MPAPAIAAIIVQKLIYKGSIQPYGFSIKGISIKWVLITVFLSIIFVLGTLAVTGIFGNTLGVESFGRLDLSQEGFNDRIIEIVRQTLGESSFGAERKLRENPIPISPTLVLAVIFVVGIISSFTVNLPFMFGEEFGWRGFMLKETERLGFIKSNLLIGVIWGLWHAPLILMGHNYPDHPVLGVLMMILFTTALSIPFAYSRLKTKSILGPCVMHGMINSTAPSFTYFVYGTDSLVGGIAGIAGIAIISFVSIGILLFDGKFVRSNAVSIT